MRFRSHAIDDTTTRSRLHRRPLAVCALALLTAGCGDGIAAPPTAPTASALPTRPTPPASPLPGSFQIAFEADSACTMLPAVARTRTYSATTGGNGSPYLIDLGTATFGGDGSYLWHTIYAKFVDDVAHLFFQDPPIWEQLTPSQYVVIYGTEAVGTIYDLPATLSFPGDFTFCAYAEPDRYPECEVPEIVCRSKDHKLTITRQ
jgi:hypothetical protein